MHQPGEVKMSGLSRERYIDPKNADESSRRSRGHRAKEFTGKQNTSRDVRIEASFEVEGMPEAEHAIEARDRGLDETLIETFPCSDALSSIPDPAVVCRIRT
jgi:hypothetical protein